MCSNKSNMRWTANFFETRKIAYIWTTGYAIVVRPVNHNHNNSGCKYR